LVTEFRFGKMQAAGNDFVLVDNRLIDAGDWSVVARRLCDRHLGAGADGLLVAAPSARAEVHMRMFNPDGTEDDCGNGLRCLALYALDEGLVSRPRFRVETLTGIKKVEVRRTTLGTAVVRADMGRARLAPDQVPVHWNGTHALGIPLEVAGESLTVHALHTGSTHCVIFETPPDSRFRRLSPLIEENSAFPERTTVLWTEVLDADSLRVRIWERGAGETLACGTGACAVAVAAHLSGRTGPTVRVASRGGVLTVEIEPSLSVTMTGPAAWVYRAVWHEAPRQP
jgi:diaminopimelate epimerase